MEPGDLRHDARCVLYVLSLYGSTAKGPKAWVKDFVLKSVIFTGVRAGVFRCYRVAPQVIRYLSNSHYAMICQEAESDLNMLFSETYVEKVVLSTEFHAPEIAWRLAGPTWDMVNEPDFLSPEDAHLVRSVVLCRLCHTRCYDYVGVSNKASRKASGSRTLALYRICSCYRRKFRYRDQRIRLVPRDQEVEGFFSIGDCEYAGQPLFLESISEWGQPADPLP